MMDIENGGQVRVLTVRQPHAHLLIHGSPSAGVKGRREPFEAD
jgi:hypothetical protein